MRSAHLVLCASLSVVACTRDATQPAAPVAPTKAPAKRVDTLKVARPRVPVEAGSLLDDHVVLEFAVYFLGPPPKDAEATATRLAKQVAPKLRVVATPRADEPGPALHFSMPPIEQYAPPSSDMLRYFARGLSQDELEKTPAATGAFVVGAVAPIAQADETHRAVLALTHALAVKWNGVLWDEATRQVFSTKAWQEQRLSWKAGLADVSSHVTLHEYRNGELLRVVSLGMSKFGLPDVVANDVSGGAALQVGHLANLVMQTLYERPTIDTAGTLDLDLTALKNAQVRSSYEEGCLPGAKKKATLDVALGEHEKGDAENRLLELAFGGGGESPQEAQHRVTSALFGSKDSLVRVRDDDHELEAARARAVAKFLALKPTFTRNKQGTMQLQVKAPFTTDTGGVEWMWVAVSTWKGHTLQGMLANEPFEVSNLKIGARVEVEESSVFDYLLTRSDGTTEGNETGAILERMQAP